MLETELDSSCETAFNCWHVWCSDCDMENALSISSSGELGERSRGTWDQAKKPLLLATIALTVGAIASRPRATQLGPGVIRTVMKGALYGALSAVPELLLLRLSKKILSHYERIPPGSAATRSF